MIRELFYMVAGCTVLAGICWLIGWWEDRRSRSYVHHDWPDFEVEAGEPTKWIDVEEIDP